MSAPRMMPTAALSLHPEAALVPEMPADQYAAFLEDVKARGVLAPIELIPGTRTVIEGRTRLKAATEAGLAAVPVVDADLRGDAQTVYMIRAALLRRQLTSSQRAALAAELEEQLAKEAKGRMIAGGKKAGRARPADAEQGVAIVPPPIELKPDTPIADVPKVPFEAVEELAAEGVHTVADLDARVKTARVGPGVIPTRYTALKELLPLPVALAAGDALVDAEAPAPAPTPAGGKARDQAAAIAGTSPRYVQEAKALKAAAPEQFAAVKAGSKTLPEAKRDAGLTPKPAPKPSALVSATGGTGDARRTAAMKGVTDGMAKLVAELVETADWLVERAGEFARLIEGVSARHRAALSVEVAKLRGRAGLIRQTAKSAKGGAA